MPTVDYELTTLAKAKTQLGITDTSKDDVLTPLLRQITQFIENFCGGRRFIETEYLDEKYDGSEYDKYTLTKKLFIRNYPLVVVDAIHYRTGSLASPIWITFSVEDYIPYFNEGYVHFFGGIVKGHLNIAVDYTAGYKIDFTQEDVASAHTLPYDLVMVATQLVSKMFQVRNSQGIKAESTEGQSITYLDVEIDKFLSGEQRAVLETYKAHYF